MQYLRGMLVVMQTQERKQTARPPKETPEELAEANKVFEDF